MHGLGDVCGTPAFQSPFGYDRVVSFMESLPGDASLETPGHHRFPPEPGDAPPLVQRAMDAAGLNPQQQSCVVAALPAWAPDVVNYLKWKQGASYTVPAISNFPTGAAHQFPGEPLPTYGSTLGQPGSGPLPVGPKPPGASAEVLPGFSLASVPWYVWAGGAVAALYFISRGSR